MDFDQKMHFFKFKVRPIPAAADIIAGKAFANDSGCATSTPSSMYHVCDKPEKDFSFCTTWSMALQKSRDHRGSPCCTAHDDSSKSVNLLADCWENQN